MVPLVFLMIYVIQRGADVLSWDFLTKDLPFVDRLPGGGMEPAIVGTLLITGAAALMAIPLGILGGIYLNEYGGKNPLARLIRFLSEVMTGVPSIVMGLFIYTFVVLNTKEMNGLAGALALGVPDAADRDPHDRPDALARAARVAGGELRVGQPPRPHHPHRRAAERGSRDRERRAARGGPRRG